MVDEEVGHSYGATRTINLPAAFTGGGRNTKTGIGINITALSAETEVSIHGDPPCLLSGKLAHPLAFLFPKKKNRVVQQNIVPHSLM